MKKVDVKGADAHLIFEYLKSQAPNEEYKGIKAKATHTMLKGISKSAKKGGTSSGTSRNSLSRRTAA